MENSNTINEETAIPSIPKAHLTVATLNYCGIGHSPFQFYSYGFEQDLARISQIYRRLIPQYFSNFDENQFKWVMGKIGKNFTKGRYSNMFDPSAGSNGDDTLMNQKQFQQEWDKVFADKSTGFNLGQIKEEEKEISRLHDFLMYRTLLEYVFGTQSFEQAITNSATTFRNAIIPFFKLSFLDARIKIEKFMECLRKFHPDVFFLQQNSPLLEETLRESEYHVVTEPTNDCLILLKKSSFTQPKDFQAIYTKISEQQKQKFRWPQHIAFAVADGYIFASVHLSSKESKFKPQLEGLKASLLQLKKSLPTYEIVFGGDLNCFLQAQGEFASQFNAYPVDKEVFTTLKKRMYTQAQYHKAEKEVREAKDCVISNKLIESGEVTYLVGGKVDERVYLPSNEHPCDHLLCVATIHK